MALFSKYWAKLQQIQRRPSRDPACPGGTLGPLLQSYPLHLPCALTQILGEPKQNRKLVAEVSLRNPLVTPLEGCFFTVEGAGLTEKQMTVDM